MKIEIGYQQPHGDWTVTRVFKNFHDFCLENLTNIEFSYLNYDDCLTQPCGICSPHNMTLRNVENKKYFIISYWDRTYELTWSACGWDTENCKGIFTSSGTNNFMNYTPFSYLSYKKIYDDLTLNAKSLTEKDKCELIFRGLLYAERLEMQKFNKIKITNEKIYPEYKYFEDLTNNKICLSLNGAAEICHRDLEIMSARSVLLRPLLTQKFHNDLKPNFHYVPFNYNSNPEIQIENIINKFNEIKNDDSFLSFIADNGWEWFKKNGTINSNVNILKELINFELLK